MGESVQFRPAQRKDLDTLRKWYRWKTPFSSHPELLMRSLSITHPNAEKTIENLNILCSREIKWEGKEGKKEGEEKGKGEEEKEEGVENKGKGGKKEKTRKERKEGREKDRGYGRFFVLVSRVKQKGIQFLKDKKQASPIQNILPPLPSKPPLRPPHSSPYRSPPPPIALRIDMISANFSVCSFLNLLEKEGEGGKGGYEEWVRGLVEEVREEEPWLLDERDIERFISLFVGAKQLRQTMIGEAFRGSLNKIVSLVNHTALRHLLSSPLWESSLSSLLSLDCTNNDEVVFVPKNDNEDLDVLKKCVDQIAEFYKNLLLDVVDGEKRPMCPVRVELFSLKKIMTNLTSHPGLLEGNFGLLDEVLWSSEENNKKKGETKKKFVNVPPGLSLLFFKHVEGLELEEKDFYFEHDGMVCRFVDSPF